MKSVNSLCMQQIRTISLKLNSLNADDYLQLMAYCSGVFNDQVEWAYANGTYNKSKAQAIYTELRKKYPELRSALLQGTMHCALEACKAKKLSGKKPLKKQYSGVRLAKTAFSLRGNLITLIGLKKRHREILHIPEVYTKIYETWKRRGATLTYDKKSKQFWIHISFENLKPVKPVEVIQEDRVVGIDRGVYNPVVLSSGEFATDAKRIRRVKGDYYYLRQSLQRKGTRSAKRHLRKLSRREMRFTRDTNHCISKKLANSRKYDVFVLERLKKFKPKKYHKNRNRKVFSWSYFQFETFLTYKAEALGKRVEYVPAAYTSQTCSKCGQTNETNRVANRYECVCGNAMHADVNAAVNIRNAYLISRQHLNAVGAAVKQPIVSAACG